MGRYILQKDKLGTGIGFLLKNYWNTEFEYYLNKENFQTENSLANNNIERNDPYAIDKKTMSGIRILAKLDLLDDVILPNSWFEKRGEKKAAYHRLTALREGILDAPSQAA